MYSGWAQPEASHAVAMAHAACWFGVLRVLALRQSCVLLRLKRVYCFGHVCGIVCGIVHGHFGSEFAGTCLVWLQCCRTPNSDQVMWVGVVRVYVPLLVSVEPRSVCMVIKHDDLCHMAAALVLSELQYVLATLHSLA